MLRRVWLFVALAFVAAATVPPGSPRVPLEADAPPPEARAGWTKAARAPGDAPLTLTFLLRQRNVAELERRLAAVSDPRSPEYGRHLSNAAVHALVAPSAAALSAVRGFLRDHGVRVVDDATPNGDMLTATTTVAKAEELLGAAYHRYVHADGTGALRTAAYSLPAPLAAHVAAVAPTVLLPSRRGARREERGGPDALLNTPTSLRRLYAVNAAQGHAPANKLAVTAFLEQRFSPADLREFQALFLRGPEFRDARARTVVPRGDDGGPGHIGGTEAMLDVEYATSLGANISAEFWGFAGRAPGAPENEPFLKWLQLVARTPDGAVPRVFSTSYGEDEASVSQAYADRVNVEFMKAGARGISLLFSSGDSGAAGDHGCVGGQFMPQWPAASPYVTAVGGTAGVDRETAVGLSSGGFSLRYARPAWQRAAVEAYLSTADLPDHRYINSTAGRAFPDIAAQAVNYLVVSSLIPAPVAGTSCASPTAAGVVALLNDARLLAGRPALGFLNPLLYAHPAALNDITSGSGNGCGLGAGYPAVEGWDAVTGLGTPNFEALAKAVAQLP